MLELAQKGFDIMIKIMFVCHGNICRSTMAEFVMKDIVKKNGMENSIFSGNAKQIAMLKSFTDNWHGQVYVDTASEQDVIDMIDTYAANGWTNMSILATYAATTKNTVEYCHSKGYKYCVSDIPVELDSDFVIDRLQSLGVDICQSGHIFAKRNPDRKSVV